MSAQPHPMRSAVLFIAFRRVEETTAVFQAIRAARPPRLYFAVDAPRPGRSGEGEQVEQVRRLADLVDWPCELKTRFSEVNQGVKYGPWNAMKWFFEHEEEGIIMEDDCLPDPTWFRFAEELLEHYRHDQRIWAIIGNNLMGEWPPSNDDSYYFTAHGYGAYWGWASWRRTWDRYDLDMKHWPELRDSGLLDGHFLSNSERTEAYGIFENSWSGHIVGWDFQSDYSRTLNGAVNIIPNVNLIRNIGFGEAGTNTLSGLDPRNKDDRGVMTFPLKHPKFLLVDAKRDLAYFNAFIRPPLFRRFRSAVKEMLPRKLDTAITPFLSRLQKRLGQ